MMSCWNVGARPTRLGSDDERAEVGGIQGWCQVLQCRTQPGQGRGKTEEGHGQGQEADGELDSPFLDCFFFGCGRIGGERNRCGTMHKE